MSLYTEELATLISTASQDLEEDLQHHAPYLAESTLGWLRELAGGLELGAYFKHPKAFPFLLFPYWLELSIQGQVDRDFQKALVYSSINAYYYTRMIDDLMDGDKPVPGSILPASAFFHSNFQKAYQPYFAAESPFFTFFYQVWLQQAEVASRDSSLEIIDEKLFREVVSQKICGAKIPLAAVAYHYQHSELLEDWCRLVELFGCWHMMYNDLFDWHKDLNHGNATYFLSEAAQRPHEQSISAWVFETGLHWGIAKLNQLMQDLLDLGEKLNSPELLAYLHERQRLLQQQVKPLEDGAAIINQLFKSKV